MIEEHPDIVVAFIAAQQQAVEELSARSPEEIAEIAEEYWKLPPEQGAKVVEDEVLFIRGWVWPTEGDASALLEISKFMVAGGLIEEPLEWQQVKDAFSKGVDLQKRAWEQAGMVPPVEAFQASETQDIRGLPVWQMEQWQDR